MPVAQSPEQQFAEAVALFCDAGSPIVLAVSGGSDSMALMHLAARLLPRDSLIVVTVDHGLRSAASQEIAQVASQAEELGLSHLVEGWQWTGKGNLQASAREGRWACLRHVALQHGAGWVWTGHTEDDQVETALMRLARGSGVDGLAGMSTRTTRDGVTIGRPLLGITRNALRQWLRGEGIAWSEDPSNEDARFDRVRARQMLCQLGELGLSRKRILQTVDHMQAAQASLQLAAREFARAHVRQEAGDLLLSRDVLDLARADTARRVFAASLCWIAGRAYKPRFEQLTEAARAALAGKTTTLGGVLISPDGNGIARLTREAAATAELRLDADTVAVTWDNRWRIEGPFKAGMTLRALGDSVKDCPSWRETGLPLTTLSATPAVWQGKTLIAAPVAGLAEGWSARIVADFHSAAFPIED